MAGPIALGSVFALMPALAAFRIPVAESAPPGLSGARRSSIVRFDGLNLAPVCRKNRQFA